MITFISPCVLPMIPVYVLYFTGGDDSRPRGKTLLRALCFVAGFSSLFVLLGVFAGSLGSLLVRYQRVVNVVCGLVMIAFGLHYAGWLRIGFLEKTLRPNLQVQSKGYGSCLLLGAVFAVGWSPCTGPFLGSAMMMAASEGGALAGMLLLLCYALGMGVPFVLCALLIEQFKAAFDAIKRHYTLINRLCGVFLIVVGVMMMAGWFARLSALLS